jgi:hypothetical protein
MGRGGGGPSRRCGVAGRKVGERRYQLHYCPFVPFCAVYGGGKGRGGERRDVEVHCDAFRRLPATPSARVLVLCVGYSVTEVRIFRGIYTYIQRRGILEARRCEVNVQDEERSWIVCEPRPLHPSSMA